MSFRAYDSFTGDEFPDHKVWCVSYLPSWQRVRMECKFSDMQLLRDALAKLTVYTTMTKDEDDLRYRLFRVHNLLNAIPIGQPSPMGIQRIPRNEASLIIEYRTVTTQRYRALGPVTTWDWHTSRLELISLWRDDAGEQFLIDMFNRLRWQRSRRMTPKPALHYFLNMIEETSHNET
jgi:hypothetical protein